QQTCSAAGTSAPSLAGCASTALRASIRSVATAATAVRTIESTTNAVNHLRGNSTLFAETLCPSEVTPPLFLNAADARAWKVRAQVPLGISTWIVSLAPSEA